MNRRNARVKVWCLTAWRHPNAGAPSGGHTGYYSMDVPVLQSFFSFFPGIFWTEIPAFIRPVIANQSADRCVKSPGRGRFPPITGHSEEHWCENPPDERYSRTTSLAPRIYEGGGPRSGRGSPPPQRGRPSQSRFACQLSRRESQGRFAPILRQHRTHFERFAVTLSFSLGHLVPLLFVIS